MDTNLLQHLLRKTANQVFNVLSLLLAEVGVLHHSCGVGGADHQVVQNILLDCDAAIVQDLLRVHHLCKAKKKFTITIKLFSEEVSSQEMLQSQGLPVVRLKNKEIRLCSKERPPTVFKTKSLWPAPRDRWRHLQAAAAARHISLYGHASQSAILPSLYCGEIGQCR